MEEWIETMCHPCVFYIYDAVSICVLTVLDNKVKLKLYEPYFDFGEEDYE